jgi:diguanylate cyclase (GGDEF)-like protein
MLRERTHPEDTGELSMLMQQIKKGKTHINCELRIHFEGLQDNVYFQTVIRGYRSFNPNTNTPVIIGFIYQTTEESSFLDSKRDPTTYLWNSRYAREYIHHYLAQPNPSGTFYLIYIDRCLDVHDKMGSWFGDHIILFVSKVMRETFRNTDILGRCGLDEFLVFQIGESDLQTIEAKCKAMEKAISRIYCGETGESVSVCIGVSRCPLDGQWEDDFFRKADKALFTAKNSEHTNYCIYDDSMEFPNGYIKQDRLFDEAKFRNYNFGGHNVFYNEITETALSLMESTTDPDSSVMLLLHKLSAYFGFDAVAVQERDPKEARTMKYIYEVIAGNVPVRTGSIRRYSEAQWLHFLYAMEQGKLIYDADDEIDLFFSDHKIRSAIKLPLGNHRYVTGSVDFIFIRNKHFWEEEEIRFLESFARILSVYLSRVRDLDEAKFLATMMQERDSVTGLFSYGKFLDRMHEITAKMKDNSSICYIYFDLGHFKYINETYGYEIGDRILRKFAEYMTSVGSARLLCASRVHSDNLILAMRNTHSMTPEHIAEWVDDKNEIAVRMLRNYIHDNMVEINSGIFVNNDTLLSVEECVSNAAYACKESKLQEWKHCLIFSTKMLGEYKRQMGFIKELRGAIENRELQVFIQPKMYNDGETVAGGEALIRWIKPNNEMIFPGEFIPPFEKSGAILDVDFFVYREVFAYLRRRLDEGLPVVPISMNVSRVHINSDRMVEYVGRLFDKYQIDPELVEFELTESIYIENLEKAVVLISKLREMGIKVSMDDFGSGYSSLNMLSHMPIDIMKIDRIFLKEDNIPKNDRIILGSIIVMGRELDICMVCEGVETKQQFEFLKDIGCDIMQGYYFGKPMPLEAFDQFLLTKKVKPMKEKHSAKVKVEV